MNEAPFEPQMSWSLLYETLRPTPFGRPNAFDGAPVDDGGRSKSGVGMSDWGVFESDEREVCASATCGSLGECSEVADAGDAGEGERLAGERPLAVGGEKWNDEGDVDAADVDMTGVRD